MIRETFNCGCGKNDWYVEEIWEKGKKCRHELQAKCCITTVYISVKWIEYAIQDRLNGLASVIPSRTNLADAYILGLVTK